MGYVDKQIASAQRKIGDAIAGKGLRDAIRSLQERSQIKDSLQALPARGAITAKRKIGRRSGSTTGDFVEQSRAFYTTLREIRSSDGLFVLQYYNVQTIVMDRATFTYRDYVPS